MKKKDIYKSINPELIEWLEPILSCYVPEYREQKAIELIQRIKELLFTRATHDSKTDCINYHPSNNKINRYPIFKFSKLIKMNTHRLSYLLNNSKRLHSKHVLHSCDNYSCINDNHLRKGTHDENMKDKIGKKRINKTLTDNEQSKIIIIQILVQYYGMKMHNKVELAKRFKVNYAKVIKIINDNRDFVYDSNIHDKYLIGGRDENNHNKS